MIGRLVENKQAAEPALGRAQVLSRPSKTGVQEPSHTEVIQNEKTTNCRPLAGNRKANRQFQEMQGGFVNLSGDSNQ